jgi:hypothetical protein
MSAGSAGDRVAGGVRPRWSSLPIEVRQLVERSLRERVVAAEDAWGGFTPGVAARLTTVDGRGVFVKVIGAGLAPHGPEIYRREAAIMASLPAWVPAPRLLDLVDHEGWVALIFEFIDGTLPVQPWIEDELARVLAAVSQLSEMLTPAPIDAPRLVEDWAEDFSGWRTLAADPDRVSGLSRWAGHPRRRARDVGVQLAVGRGRWCTASRGSAG